MSYPGNGSVSGTAAAVAVVCLLLTIVRACPPAPVESGVEGRFSAVEAGELLDSLYSAGTSHPTGSENNRRLEERILAHLQGLGYEPTTQRTIACRESGTCGHVENILARLEGTAEGKAVLLAVHYDSVAAGPSVSDDGVAVAIALELARLLRSGPRPRNDVIFLIDDGEEAALLGAIGFTVAHPWAAEVGAVVNLEARGTAGRSYMFETGPDNAWLIDLMNASVPRPATGSVFYSIYKRLPRDTDFTIFKQHGINGVNFAFIQQVVHYHTPLDDLAHVTPATMQHQGDNALGMVQALANVELDSPPAGTASWFDVWGFGILSWPESWNLPLAVSSLLLILVAFGLSRQRGWITVSQLWQGLVLYSAAVLGAMVLALIARWLLVSIGKLPAWPAVGWTPQAAFWLIGIGTPALVISFLGPRAGAAATWLGACWWLSVLSLASSVLLPGATYLFLAPALTGAVSAVLIAVWKAPWIAPLATAVTIVAACAAQLIIAWSLWEAMGIKVMPVVSFLVASVTTLVLAPAADMLERRRKLPLAGLALAVALVLISISLPAYSEESPRALNLYFVQDADTGRAQLAARPGPRPLPAPLADAVGWEGELGSLYPWTDGNARYRLAAGEPLPDPPPTLEVVEEEATAIGRRLRARFRSGRGADRGALIFSEPDRIVSVHIDGWSLDLQNEAIARRYDSGFRVVSLATMPAEGIEVLLEIEDNEPLELFLVDQSYGLPPVADVLLQARPANAVPYGLGDLTVVHTRTRL